MGSPFGEGEKTVGSSEKSGPQASLDPVDYWVKTVESPQTYGALASGALGGVATSGVLAGIDRYAIANSWMNLGKISLTASVSDAAPGWARGYLETMSPTAAAARQAAGKLPGLASDVVMTTKDFAAGAKLFTGATPESSAAAVEVYLGKLGSHQLATVANPTAAEALAYSRQHIGSIGGAAERDAALRIASKLESEMAVAEMSVVRVGLGRTMLRSAGVGGASYVADDILSRAVKNHLGQDSELGHLLEPSLTGSFFTGAGSALGKNPRTKIAWTAAGWVIGKVGNYYCSDR